MDTSLSSIQHPLMSQDIPPKTGSETSPTITGMLVNCFCKIVCHCCWMALLALLFIVLALLAIVQQQKVQKCDLIMFNKLEHQIIMPTRVLNAILVANSHMTYQPHPQVIGEELGRSRSICRKLEDSCALRETQYQH